jgi:hypothetical protein
MQARNQASHCYRPSCLLLVAGAKPPPVDGFHGELLPLAEDDDHATAVVPEGQANLRPEPAGPHEVK